MSLVGEHRPYWIEQGVRRLYPTLRGDTDTGVLVVGAGITGLTAAMRLLEAGQRVTVVDMSHIGEGTTGHSTGHLDTLADDMLHSLIHAFGADKARLFVQSKQAAIDHIGHRDRELNLRSDFRRVDGWLYAEPDQDHKSLQREVEAARDLGLIVERRKRCPLPFATDLALRVAGQGRFSPLRYIGRLAEAFVERGGQLFEGTRMEEDAEEDGRVRVKTNRGTITADAVIMAGHAAIEGGANLDWKNLPYQSYVLGVRVKEPVADALYWDMADPYHYTRLGETGDDTFLIVGGADHPTGKEMDTNAAFDELEQYVRARYVVHAVTHRWSHEWWEPVDGLPYIGRVPGFQNIYIGTAFSGEGLTLGTVAGLLTSDLVLGRENPWAELYDPSRLKLATGAARYLKGAADGVKGFIVDRFTAGQATSLGDVLANHGALVKIDGEPYAVYRDEAGELHAMSPVCRHQGCIVHWNDAEKTWDCPCHGGRYDAKGRVIMGPPRTDLPGVELPVLHGK